MTYVSSLYKFGLYWGIPSATMPIDDGVCICSTWRGPKGKFNEGTDATGVTRRGFTGRCGKDKIDPAGENKKYGYKGSRQYPKCPQLELIYYGCVASYTPKNQLYLSTPFVTTINSLKFWHP